MMFLLLLGCAADCSEAGGTPSAPTEVEHRFTRTPDRGWHDIILIEDTDTATCYAVLDTGGRTTLLGVVPCTSTDFSSSDVSCDLENQSE